MKKLYVALVLLSMCAFSACSGGSGWNATELANNAIAALNNITDNWTCTTTTFTTCECPGGGTAVFSGPYDPNASITNKATQTVTVTDCTDSASGLSFTGTMSIDDQTGEGTVDFSTFGQCSNFQGTFDVSGTSCGGSATGTCQGQDLTCNWTASGDECICGS